MLDAMADPVQVAIVGALIEAVALGRDGRRPPGVRERREHAHRRSVVVVDDARDGGELRQQASAPARSCASPPVRCRPVGSPSASTIAWIFVLSL